MTIELTMQSGAKYFLDPKLLDSFGVKDDPESYIYSCILGTRGGMVRGYAAADLAGVPTFLNPRLIESAKVTE